MSGELISNFGGKVPQRAIRHLNELPICAAVIFDTHDFGAGTNLSYVNGVDGKRGKLVTAEVFNVTEGFTAAGDGTIIQLGDGTDVDAFSTLTVGAVVAIGARGQYSIGNGIEDGVDVAFEDGATVTLTVTADSGAAGIGDLALNFLYFK